MLFTKAALSDGDIPMRNSLFRMGAVSEILLRCPPPPWYDVQNQSMQGLVCFPGATKPLESFPGYKVLFVILLYSSTEVQKLHQAVQILLQITRNKTCISNMLC